QKAEMARQTAIHLNGIRSIEGYLEIGGAGRYIKPISTIADIKGPVYLISDEPIDGSPVRILERGQIAKYNTKKLTYLPSDFDHIPDNSLELVTIFIGLHHCPVNQLDEFMETLTKKLKSGGHLILRDHNVETDLMHTFVAIAHDIYNAGTGAPWEINEQELRNFTSIKVWKERFQKYGYIDSEVYLLQDNDPTDNTLMHFIRQ
ncbi:class I SAM-dependent methyltransferase, partial [Candidatus Gracilibacteria bacterium]|nr:class I SAM-dependent methyltransferase [Candidatus Gracilibacteria bacterium]